MSMSIKPANAPTSLKGGSKPSSGKSRNFMAMVLDMGWQLAIAVVVPLLLGVYIGNLTHAHTPCVLVGFTVAMILSAFVIRRFYQLANSIPVPKLTPAQKDRLHKLNQEDEDD